MANHTVGYFVGSLSSQFLNRTLARALIQLAPRELEFEEIPYSDLPLFNRDLEGKYPPPAIALKEAIIHKDAILFVTPEYAGVAGVRRSTPEYAGVRRSTPDGNATNDSTRDFLRRWIADHVFVADYYASRPVVYDL